MSRPDAGRQTATKCSTRTATASGSTSRKRCRASCCCAKAKPRSRRCTTWKQKIDALNEIAGQTAAGRADRALLRPQRTDRRHHRDGAREPVLGMVLVTVILLMFLSNVRSALIVAINIPLALLFAFAVLFLRGKSANLLSIGAVDFGIIVDSSVIMVENIYPPPELRREHGPAAQASGSCWPRARWKRACSSPRRSWSAHFCRCSP